MSNSVRRRALAVALLGGALLLSSPVLAGDVAGNADGGARVDTHKPAGDGDVDVNVGAGGVDVDVDRDPANRPDGRGDDDDDVNIDVPGADVNVGD